MMANFLGVHVFNKGIEEYLKKYTYQNAQQVIFFRNIKLIEQNKKSKKFER